jgi:hypothetical protein
MRRIERYNFLSIFGGGKPIDYVSLIQIGTLHFANPQNRKDIYIGSSTFSNAKTFQQVFERILYEAIEYGLVKRVENYRTRQLRLQPTYQISKEDWDYQITQRGDECLRIEQIERAGDYSFYKKFDRTLDSAAKINPTLFK